MASFLQELARPRPDPGGGAAAAFGAGLGLALMEKVIQLEGRRRSKSEASSRPNWDEVLAHLRRLAASLEHLRDSDIQAYFDLVAARTSGDPGRLGAAAREAVDCPLKIMDQAGAALELLAWAGANCRRHLVSDLLVACEFLNAAQRGARHIAGANLHQIPEPQTRETLARKLQQVERDGENSYQRVRTALLARKQALDRCRG